MRYGNNKRGSTHTGPNVINFGSHTTSNWQNPEELSGVLKFGNGVHTNRTGSLDERVSTGGDYSSKEKEVVFKKIKMKNLIVSPMSALSKTIKEIGSG